jgi:HPt (histidine-containing phosphotransfer) domain-containing protein
MTANPESVARVKELLKQLWAQHRDTVFERLAIVEAASVGALELDDAARAEARSAAHKLAGALGNFGYQQGTDWARESERIFERGDLGEADRTRLIENAKNIRALIETQEA